MFEVKQSLDFWTNTDHQEDDYEFNAYLIEHLVLRSRPDEVHRIVQADQYEGLYPIYLIHGIHIAIAYMRTKFDLKLLLEGDVDDMTIKYDIHTEDLKVVKRYLNTFHTKNFKQRG